METNTKYKSSVFSFLFSDPDTLRELYCALEDVTLPADVAVTINTLDDVLFMDRVNDISFEIGGKLVVLIEHQSTINPNMALRLLLYIGRVYEKIIRDKRIYSTKKIPVPQPEFFVLYNGLAPYPDENYLRLSEAFESTKPLGLPEKETPSLELVVRVININKGKNEAVAGRCQTLAQYSVFVAKVREHEKEGLTRQEAVKKAVIFCRSHDILREFLEQNSTEVVNMLLTEWNWDDALDVRYEEGLEEGLQKGLEKGHEEGCEEGGQRKARDIARKMKNAGRSFSEIADFTGLPSEIIEQIE